MQGAVGKAQVCLRCRVCLSKRASFRTTALPAPCVQPASGVVVAQQQKPSEEAMLAPAP